MGEMKSQTRGLGGLVRPAEVVTFFGNNLKRLAMHHSLWAIAREEMATFR